jgi:response regulator RpfG family c-di-GMP phosphodiesterase
MNKKILFVDDEINILQGYQRSLRKEFHVETATSGEQALAMIEGNGPYSVIVADMRMPRMDGVQFLSLAMEMAPESVRIMLTGNADQQTAMEAVNEGHIFRFLTKPCAPETLAKSLLAGVEQYRLIRAEKELLENTLSGSIKTLTEVLSLTNPTAFGRASRVHALVRHMVEVLKVENAWQVEIAAMLSQVGCITVPEKVLTKVHLGSTLTGDELRMLQAHPTVGSDLISRIPRLEPVSEIIAYQEKRFNGSGLPDDTKRGTEIPEGARMLKVALDFDKLVQSNMSNSEAYQEMTRRYDWYDSQVIEALETVINTRLDVMFEVRYVMAKDIASGMILADDLYSMMGYLMVAKGQELTDSYRIRLMNLIQLGVIEEPVKVLVAKEGLEHQFDATDSKAIRIVA